MAKSHSLENQQDEDTEILSQSSKNPCHIARLPDDLVIYIFSTCVSSDSESRPSALRSPVVLGHVCRVWRRLTLATPLLWSTITIPSTYLNKAKFTLDAMAVKVFLSRSQECPLTITMRYLNSRDKTPAMIEGTNMVIGEILPHSNRWYSITMAIPSECIPQLLPGLSSGLPSITTLLLHPTSTVDRVLPTTVSIDLSCSKLLKYLSVGLNAKILGENLTDLRRLVVRFSSLADTLFCLQNYPNVTNVHITLYSLPDDQLDSSIETPACRLASLEKLWITSGQDISTLLDRLYVPRLENLSIGSSFGVDSPKLLNFFKVSRPPLLTLNFSGVNISRHAFLQILQYLPSLTVLRCMDSHLSQAVGDAFRNFASPLCPRLVSISLKCRMVDVRHGTSVIAQLVVHRWKAGRSGGNVKSIREVGLQTREEMDLVDKYPGIRLCRQEGLNVYIYKHGKEMW
ncbi:hypothetical protein BD410DRAFT_793741 [Rickenella mellea]|uniref:Uncharacterized protein n=1 Tax=Rickenella mellea TaxID=50990 RepID=A0A4Y7PU39_9AGAM|nr:hypothetical protein BD410DRAFT_793741 [Rickenella mellea]